MSLVLGQSTAACMSVPETCAFSGFLQPSVIQVPSLYWKDDLHRGSRYLLIPRRGIRLEEREELRLEGSEGLNLELKV